MLLPNSSSFETLINYFSFAAWVFYGCTVSALLWLRYKKPEMKRPYKVSHRGPGALLLGLDKSLYVGESQVHCLSFQLNNFIVRCRLDATAL